SNTGENGNSAVFQSDVVDQFLDKNCFTYSCTTKQTDFSTFDVWSEQVDNFNSCFQNFGISRQVFKLWRFTVDRTSGNILSQIFTFVDMIAQYVKHSA